MATPGLKRFQELTDRVAVLEAAGGGGGALKRTINMSTAEIAAGTGTSSSKTGIDLRAGAIIDGLRIIVNEGISGGGVTTLGFFVGKAGATSFISAGVVGTLDLTTPGSETQGVNDNQEDMGGIIPRLEITAASNLDNITAGDVTIEILYHDVDDATEGP
jgi:hypothetical protein